MPHSEISIAPPVLIPTQQENGMPLGIVAPTQRERSRRMIGEIVVDLGLADRVDVEVAVAEARATNSSTGAALVARGTLTPDQLARVIAERFGVDYVDLSAYSVDFRACSLVTPEAARRYEAVPIGFKDARTLLLVTSDPANVLAIDDVAMMTGYDVHPVVASREDIGALVAKLARLEDVGEPEEEEDDSELFIGDVRDESDDAPVIKLVHSIIAEAIELRASDIHFDPDGQEMRVHYRIDGVLKPSNAVPRRMARGVVSRVKIMASLDISERRLPQDGRLSLAIDGRSVDVRVVTLPLVGGESVVMRVLDHDGGVIDLDRLGLRDAEFERLRRAIAQPYGAILVTGPTGSGKTTTLYGGLALLNTGERSIITIEDPVEYRVDGIKQMQVNAKVGMTFAKGLRTMVRADPDIIMVGEIRDRETAQIAIEAALTGHLVLSTLHTRDAPTAITRLVDMGIEPFLTASALDCIVAQRLARTLCTCKIETVIPAEVLIANGYQGDDDIAAFAAHGCGRCGGTGYRGRIGLFEVMTVTEEIRSMVMRGVSAPEIARHAEANGMRRLRDDGLEKVRTGHTSLAEVGRVAGS